MEKKPYESVPEKGRGAGRFRELDYFNAVGCLFVILLHVLSLGITSLDPGSWQAALVFVPWQFAAYVVPAFLLCGAVKMAMSFESGVRYFPYILRRTLKVYVPYLVYTVVYYLAFLPIHYVAGTLPELFHYLLTGTLSGQFYYVLIVMQFYLLMPLWRWMARRVPWYAGVLVSLFVTLLMGKADSLLGALGLRFAYFDRVFPTYLVFWTVGIYVGKYYGRARESLQRYPAAALGLLSVTGVFMVLAYLAMAKGLYFYDQGVLKIFSDLAASAALLCLCLRLDAAGETRLGGLLKRVHGASLSVFLSHALFLTLGTVLFLRLGVTGTGPLLLLRAAVAYTLPFLLHGALERVRAALTGRIRRGRGA